MKSKSLAPLLIVAILVVAGAIGWSVHQDFQYRKLHGTVTEVTYLNWQQEVEETKSKLPVVIYFYDSTKPYVYAQHGEIDDFAWNTAGEVKVVRCDLSKPENRLIGILHGAIRDPAFVVIAGDSVVLGSAGALASTEQLEALISQLKKSTPTP